MQRIAHSATASGAAPGDGATAACALVGEAATLKLGAALGAQLRTGDCVTLSGPLGAGKSVLARAIVRAALGEPGREVPSPSYTLVNLHAAPGGTVWHADLYRLSGPEETAELGLEEALSEGALVVEWPDRMGPFLPARRLDLALAVTGETARHLAARAHGAGWEGALAAIGEAGAR